MQKAINRSNSSMTAKRRNVENLEQAKNVAMTNEPTSMRPKKAKNNRRRRRIKAKKATLLSNGNLRSFDRLRFFEYTRQFIEIFDAVIDAWSLGKFVSQLYAHKC